jgi:hypothetical protein
VPESGDVDDAMSIHSALQITGSELYINVPESDDADDDIHSAFFYGNHSL